MIRSSHSFLLIGTALITLAACSGTKGPGEIGSKDDIVVNNKGLPGAQAAPAQTAAAPVEGQDFSSTVEQGAAAPAPEVAAAEPVSAQAEPLPDTSPAMEQAVEQQRQSSAPVPSSVAADTNPPDAASASVSDIRPIDGVAPTEPVGNQTVTPPSSQVYPSTANAKPTAPAPMPAAAPAMSPSEYPLDPNAPYSPKAVAAAQAAKTTAPATPVMPAAAGANMADPAVIRAAQAALAVKGAYKGAATGTMDAEFLNAVSQYQAENGLPMGGLNEATLRQLGVVQ